MHSRLSLAVALIIITFTSCNNVPEHTKYIPKEAMVVVGINTKELSKKLAWDAIMGSKLMDELKSKMPEGKDAAEGLGNAGIDPLNTTYFYFTPNGATGAYNYITAIVPLSDAKKWESYLQKSFKNPQIKEVDKRKESLLEKDLFASWNEEMVIVRKVFVAGANEQPEIDYSMIDSVQVPQVDLTEPQIDPVRLSADMHNVFAIQKESITDDKRFSKLQSDGNDITLWVNYDVLMNKLNGFSGGMAGGLALNNSLWKEAALASGFDFEKGKLDADMKYYVSDEMNEVYKKFGNKNVDKEMLDRLPTQNLGLITSYYLAPEGMKAILEKMGVLGFMSLALAESNLTVDDVFQSFSGEMVMSLNDFRASKSNAMNASDSAEGNPVQYNPIEYKMGFTFAMKLKDKERFAKLLSYVKQQNGLETIDATTYKLVGNDSVFIGIDGDYIVIANSPSTTKAFLTGSYKSQQKSEIVQKNVYGQPFGLFMDIQSFLNGIALQDSDKGQGEKEMLEEIRKVFKDITMKGGDNKKEHFSFEGSLNFMNEEENSLLQLLNYTSNINEIKKRYDSPPPVAVLPDTTIRN